MGCCCSATEKSSRTSQSPPEQIQVRRKQKLLIKTQPGTLVQSIKILKLLTDLDHSQIQKFAYLQNIQISSQLISATLNSQNPTQCLGLSLILSSQEPKKSKIEALNCLIIQQALTKDEIATLIDQIIDISSQTLAGEQPDVHLIHYIDSLKSKRKEVQEKIVSQLTEGKTFVKKQTLKQRFQQQVLDSSKLRQVLYLASHRQPLVAQEEIIFQPCRSSLQLPRITPKVPRTPIGQSANLLLTEASESESSFNFSNYLESPTIRSRASSYNPSQSGTNSKLNRSVFDSLPRKSSNLPYGVSALQIPRRNQKTFLISPREVKSGQISRKRSPQVFTIKYNYKVGQETKQVVMQSSEDPVKFGHQFSVKNGLNMRQRDGLIQKLKELKLKTPTNQ